MKDGKQVNSAIAQSKDAAIKINGGIEYDAIEEEPYEKDKGQPHKKAETKTRKQPEYFVLVDKCLVFNGTHDKASEYLQNCLNEPKDTKVIMGHEIKFTRQISFHIK